VELKNLQPNATYNFRVETGQGQGSAGGEVESQKVLGFKITAQGCTSAAQSTAPLIKGSRRILLNYERKERRYGAHK